MLDVLPDHGDLNFVLGIADPMDQFTPVTNVEPTRFQSQLIADLLVQLVLNQSQRDFVNGELFVDLFDDGLLLNIAEQGNLGAVIMAKRAFGPDDKNIGLNPDFTQLTDAVLGRLCLRFAGCFEVRHQRQVDEQAVVFADVERDLPDCFEKRQTFDVPDSPPKLGDNDINIWTGEVQYAAFDFVGDVGNNLDCRSQIFTAAFFFDDALVNLPRGVVRLTSQRTAGEAFVVSEVEICLGTIFQHIDFAVLIGAHRPWIDVDVRIQLLHPYIESPPFEQQSDRRRCQPFAQRADNSSGDENVLGHLECCSAGRKGNSAGGMPAEGRILSEGLSMNSSVWSRDQFTKAS